MLLILLGIQKESPPPVVHREKLGVTLGVTFLSSLKFTMENDRLQKSMVAARPPVFSSPYGASRGGFSFGHMALGT